MTPTLRVPLTVVIMAGGRGTRFWPRSRNRLPKQCIALMGERTLLQRTLDRVQGLVPPEQVLVVTGKDMSEAVREQLPELPAENILVEPCGRNTAPCIAWATVEIARRYGGEAIMAVLPADHLVDDEEDFQRALYAGAKAASETNGLITLGIRATRPETGFGYIRCGEALGEWDGRSFHHVQGFVEKPDRETANEYVASGQYYWNAGIFLWSVDAIRDAFQAYLPNTWASMARLEFEPTSFATLWDTFDAISIDYGILEHAKSVYVLPASFGWSDVGSWTAIPDIAAPSDGGWVESQDCVSIDAGGNVVHAPGKLVALVGVDDLVIVDTPDALLVTRREDAQRIREVISRLEHDGLTKYL